MSPEEKQEIIKHIHELEEVIFKSHSAVAKVQSESFSSIKNELHHLNGYGKVYKWLRTDFGFLVALFAFLAGAFGIYYGVKNDIAELQKSFMIIIKDLDTVENKTHEISDRVSKVEGFLLTNKQK